jgi:hypothetical protein
VVTVSEDVVTVSEDVVTVSEDVVTVSEDAELTLITHTMPVLFLASTNVILFGITADF